MDRIQTQASKLWDILFDEETADTYQNALNLTGNILKESAQLVWLVLCSFFVFGAWFADASTKTGKGVRDWIDNKDAIAPSPDAIAKKISAPKGKSLLDTGRESVAAALNKAREELGLDPNAPLAAPRKDSPVAKLVTPAETKTASSPSASTSTTSSSPSSTTTGSTASSSTTADSSSPASTARPAAGAAAARPATSEGQNIGSSYAASTGSGSPSGGFGSSSSSSSQSGAPQSSRYDASQDFDDDIEEEDFGDDAGSSWAPQTDD